jgi:hypothetical protein
VDDVRVMIDGVYVMFGRAARGRGGYKRKATWGKGLQRHSVSHRTMRDGVEVLRSCAGLEWAALDQLASVADLGRRCD